VALAIEGAKADHVYTISCSASSLTFTLKEQLKKISSPVRETENQSMRKGDFSDLVDELFLQPSHRIQRG
jgi:hypothetical protein